MKRINKFRGLKTDRSGWVYGSLINNMFFSVKTDEPVPYILNTEDCDDSCCSWEDLDDDYGIYEVYPETVGQYTGLKDKNGVAIYEGDIIGWSYYCQEDLIKESSVVKWVSETLSFDIGDYNKPDFCPLEIIGNIHEKGGEK